MRKSGLLVFVVFGVVILAACDSGDETVLPTLASIDDITATSTVAPTEPPAGQPTADDPTPTREALRQRPTLPPTWTPIPPTETPTPTPTEFVPTQAPTPIPEIDACELFQADPASSDQNIRVGDAPTVSWTALADDSVRLYRITVQDEFGVVRHQRLIEETTYTIPASAFTDAIRYGWEVAPLDELGQPICLGRGGMLDARN